jgi:hypothetical protein
MNNNILQNLKETHQALKEGCDELKLTLEELRIGRCTIDQKQEVVDRIKALKELYQQQIQELSLTLPDGRTLLRPQYEALERFAGNNNLKVEDLLDGVTINGHAIVECDFSDSELTTLEGLQGVWSIKKLNVRWNKGLTSLKGIPTQEIEEIDAYQCDLTGDLSEIAGASKLRTLDVRWNKGLTSLKGIPTQEIEEIDAYQCDLTGDLSEIAGASKLRKLVVRWNKGLTSLKGIPTQEIEEIHAAECGLTGDLSEIAGATKLKKLLVSENKSLTSLKGIPAQEIEEIHASDCGLTGDHTFLSQAPKLREFWLKGNAASLTLDLSKFRPGVVKL